MPLCAILFLNIVKSQPLYLALRFATHANSFVYNVIRFPLFTCLKTVVDDNTSHVANNCRNDRGRCAAT